jgi:integrase
MDEIPNPGPNEADTQWNRPASGKRGWHANGGVSPRLGQGSATVEPIRSPKDIPSIKGTLAHKPRDFALFVVGIHAGLRGGDLLAIHWSDAMSADGRIFDRITLTESKTKKRRQLALRENARDALAKWRAHSPTDYAGFYLPPAGWIDAYDSEAPPTGERVGTQCRR